MSAGPLRVCLPCSATEGRKRSDPASDGHFSPDKQIDTRERWNADTAGSWPGWYSPCPGSHAYADIAFPSFVVVRNGSPLETNRTATARAIKTLNMILNTMETTHETNYANERKLFNRTTALMRRKALQRKDNVLIKMKLHGQRNCCDIEHASKLITKWSRNVFHISYE